MNLLLTAPLYDNRGSVRYFIGAQIDVSGLIEDGRGLDSFERYLAENRPNRNRDSDQSDQSSSQKHLRTLNEFGKMLSLDESSLLTSHHSRASSLNDNASSVNYSPLGALGRDPTLRRTRRVLGTDDDDEADKNAWALSSAGPSGKLPGVYQNVSSIPTSPTPPFPLTLTPTALLLLPPPPHLLTRALTVPSRPPPPLPPYHFRLSGPPYPRPAAIALP